MAEAAQLRLEYVPLADLVRAPRNPKDHDAEGIAASIDRHGFVEPVIVDERTHYLVGGHGRLDDLTLRKAQGQQPPARVLVTESGDWLVPTVLGWASSSDADAEALLIGLNQLPPSGGWRQQELYDMLDNLATSPGGLDGTGYNADALDDLLAELTEGAGRELAAQATEAAHAEHTPRGDPAVPREVQGLREVGLMFNAEQHREYQALLAQLKAYYSEDAAPMVVLYAMRAAADNG